VHEYANKIHFQKMLQALLSAAHECGLSFEAIGERTISEPEEWLLLTLGQAIVAARRQDLTPTAEAMSQEEKDTDAKIGYPQMYAQSVLAGLAQSNLGLAVVDFDKHLLCKNMDFLFRD
jgi:hypothetical protein